MPAPEEKPMKAIEAEAVKICTEAHERCEKLREEAATQEDYAEALRMQHQSEMAAKLAMRMKSRLRDAKPEGKEEYPQPDPTDLYSYTEGQRKGFTSGWIAGRDAAAAKLGDGQPGYRIEIESLTPPAPSIAADSGGEWFCNKCGFDGDATLGNGQHVGCNYLAVKRPAAPTMSEAEIVEKVAKAMSPWTELEWEEEADSTARDKYERYARAALSTLRELGVVRRMV